MLLLYLLIVQFHYLERPTETPHLLSTSTLQPHLASINPSAIRFISILIFSNQEKWWKVLRLNYLLFNYLYKCLLQYKKKIHFWNRSSFLLVCFVCSDDWAAQSAWAVNASTAKGREEQIWTNRNFTNKTLRYFPMQKHNRNKEAKQNNSTQGQAHKNGSY